jgi:hypothetical protein
MTVRYAWTRTSVGGECHKSGRTQHRLKLLAPSFSPPRKKRCCLLQVVSSLHCTSLSANHEELCAGGVGSRRRGLWLLLVRSDLPAIQKPRASPPGTPRKANPAEDETKLEPPCLRTAFPCASHPARIAWPCSQSRAISVKRHSRAPVLQHRVNRITVSCFGLTKQDTDDI